MSGVKEIPLAKEAVGPAAAQAEWLDGLIAIAPVAAIIMPVGVLFGAVSTAKGLTALEASLMSVLVFAGGAQIAAVDLWVAPVPIAAIVLSTFLINARHILMGVSLAPKTHAFTPWQRIAAFFFLTDEAWALSERRALHRPLKPAFWFPLALMVPATWIAGTFIGAHVGNGLGDLSTTGADFAFTALLIGIIASFSTSRIALAAVVASSATAALTHCVFGAPWHVVVGAVAGIAAAYASAGREGTPRTCP